MFILPISTTSHYEWQIPAEISELAPVSHCPSTARQPHLILHFDMNKTMIASDKEDKKTAHDVVSAEIAERVVDCWDDSLLFPISYANYVNHYLLPNPNHSQEIKNQQKETISKVLQFLEESEHPSYAKMQQMYNHATAVLEQQSTQIFKSFYRLIEYLKEKAIPFTLVIRTFGSEGSEVAEELNKAFGEAFMADFRTVHKGHLDGSERDLYNLVANVDHHLIIRDDWEWWFSHDQNWKYGKPFPVDPEDSNHISLFFDDNAGIDLFAPEENIVFPYNVTTGEPISPSALIDQGRLIPVEMLQALCDETYYIRFIEKALHDRC